jgi:hypothetical protein
MKPVPSSERFLTRSRPAGSREKHARSGAQGVFNGRWESAVVGTMANSGAQTGVINRDQRARILADMRKVGSALGHRPTRSEYGRAGRFSPEDVLRAAGTAKWNEALTVAGLDVSLGSTRGNKYNARRTREGNFVYASGHEASRGRDVGLLEAAGEINDVRRQVWIEVLIDGEVICRYRADFVYREVATNRIVIEDPKGKRTPLYLLKKKIIEALSPIKIEEI